MEKAVDISELNSAQQEAVTADDRAILVIAGAGSGKTRTIVYRLAWLAEQGIDPASMLLLTFTRKASREMLSRAAEMPSISMHGVFGGTFHGFAFSVLSRRQPAWATGKCSVIDSDDATIAMTTCIQALELRKKDPHFPKASSVISLLSRAKNKELTIQKLLQEEYPHLLVYTEDLQNLEFAYQTYRRERNLLNYDDLLSELEIMLRDTKNGLAESLQWRYRYIMVDEYQDTNPVQARLVQLLSGEHGNIMVVGDDAQSIYAFRGADIRNILNFPTLFPACRRISLEENYRSTQPILDVANAVLASSPYGFKKNLFTRQHSDIPPRLVHIICPNDNMHQAYLVANRIQELLNQAIEPSEIAVLFRAGFHSYYLETELNRRKLPFVKYGGLRYTEAAHVRDVLAFLRMIVNPADEISFRRLALFCRGIGEKRAEHLYRIIKTKDIDAAQEAVAKYPELKENFAFIVAMRQEKMSPAALMNKVLTHYHPHLLASYPEDWPKRQQSLEELAHLSATYANLEDFVSDLSLDSSPQDSSTEQNNLILSTVHSAKGLEWDAVLILDLVENRFPGYHAFVKAEEYEEERRLMYVACTRARKSLDLFVPSRIISYDNSNFANPSPFVLDLPESAVEVWKENSQEQLYQCAASAFLAQKLRHRMPGFTPVSLLPIKQEETSLAKK